MLSAVDYREWMKANGVARISSEAADGLSMYGRVFSIDTEDDFHLRQFVPDAIDGPRLLHYLMEYWTRKLAQAREG